MLVSYEAITAFESTLAERVALVDGYLVVEGVLQTMNLPNLAMQRTAGRPYAWLSCYANVISNSRGC